MDEGVKSELIAVIEAAVSRLNRSDCVADERWIYKRLSPGRIDGHTEVVAVPGHEWLLRLENQHAATFDGLLRAQYAAQIDHVVGTRSTGQSTLDMGAIVRNTMMKAAEDFLLGAPARAGAMSAVEWLTQLLDSENVRISFMAPIANLRLNTNADVELFAGAVLHQLADEEISALYGGSTRYGLHISRGVARPMDEWAFVGSWQEPKIIGVVNDPDQPHLRLVQQTITRGVLILRAFRPKPVGATVLRMISDWPTPGGIVTLTSGHEYVPFGAYDLDSDGVKELQAFARLFDVPPPPALDVALARLSFAAVRTDPRDRIVDAVIGMEAILLAAVRETELGFRFRLNFAMLEADPKKRSAAHDVARDLYNLRSTIAHGGVPDEPVRIAGRQMSLKDAADLASDTLRGLVAQFLPMNAEPEYLKTSFWTSRYFGVT